MCRTVAAFLLLAILLPSCVVGNSSSGDNHEEKQPIDFNQPVLQLVEKFRHGMADGFPQLNLPVMEPYAWKGLHINDLNNNILRFNAELKDGITRGLNQFNITNFNIQIPTRKLEFQLIFPSVQTVGRYRAKGQLAGFVPFDRSGKYWLQLHALHVHGTVHCYIWRKHLLVRDMNIILSVKTTQANFERIMPMSWNTALFNRIVSGKIPEYLRNNRNNIALQIRAAVKPRLNEILWRYDVEEILKMMENGTEFMGR